MNDKDVDELQSPPRLLLLGAGAVVSEYYLPALAKLGYLAQVVIVDRDRARLQQLHQHYPNVQCVLADFRDLLNSSNVGVYDAAIVALPNHLHEDACTRSLAAGLHVLCEKPLALKHEVCLQLARMAEDVARVLAVGMVRRYLPAVVALREALSNNLIGGIRNIELEDGTPYSWLSDTGDFFRPENGGVLADMGIHYLDLIEHLVGPLAPVSYRDDARGGVEANVEFALRTEAGLPVHIVLSRTYTLRNMLTLRGEYGELIVRKEVPDYCEWHPYSSGIAGVLRATAPFADSSLPYTFASCFVEQLRRFTLAIQQGHADVDGRAAARGIGLIEWAYQHRQATPSQPRSTTRPVLPPAPVVVTGGTGFIGAHLIERLHEIKIPRIIAPVRRYRNCAPIARFPVELPRVNLLNAEQVRASLEGARFVFHLAYGRDGERAEQLTVDGTRIVVEAAIAAGVECVVALSTMYVFGHPSSLVPVNEQWPYAPVGDEYGRSKMLMEQWCLERSRSSQGTRIVVLNPSCVYGPGGKTYSILPVELASNGGFCWIDGGQGVVNYTYVDNLVDAMLLAATTPSAHGERFIINDGATCWRSFLEPLLEPWVPQVPDYTQTELQMLHDSAGSQGIRDLLRVMFSEQRVVDTFKSIPSVQAALGVIDRLTPDVMAKIRTARHSVAKPLVQAAPSTPSPPLWLAELFGPTSTVFSSAKAQTVLNWKPLVGLEQGQRQTIAWLREAHIL